MFWTRVMVAALVVIVKKNKKKWFWTANLAVSFSAWLKPMKCKRYHLKSFKGYLENAFESSILFICHLIKLDYSDHFSWPSSLAMIDWRAPIYVYMAMMKLRKVRKEGMWNKSVIYSSKERKERGGRGKQIHGSQDMQSIVNTSVY